MLFNSLTFIAFFLVVYAMYLVLTHRYQNCVPPRRQLRLLRLLGSAFLGPDGSFRRRWITRFGLLLGPACRTRARPQARMLVVSIVNLWHPVCLQVFQFLRRLGLDRLLVGMSFGLQTDVRLLRCGAALSALLHYPHSQHQLHRGCVLRGAGRAGAGRCIDLRVVCGAFSAASLPARWCEAGASSAANPAASPH